jgi:hypothetical protein
MVKAYEWRPEIGDRARARARGNNRVIIITIMFVTCHVSGDQSDRKIRKRDSRE